MKKSEKFAVIRVKNQQLLVNEGKTYELKKLAGNPGDKVEAEVLLTANEDKVEVGNPVIKEADVEAEIVEQKKGEKVTSKIFKAKSRYRKTTGHRPLITVIKVKKIS